MSEAAPAMGGSGYIVRLVTCRVNRPDVNDLFSGGICKTAPRKTAQTKRNQDDS
jgi:hypothetical protein